MHSTLLEVENEVHPGILRIGYDTGVDAVLMRDRELYQLTHGLKSPSSVSEMALDVMKPQGDPSASGDICWLLYAVCACLLCPYSPEHSAANQLECSVIGNQRRASS